MTNEDKGKSRLLDFMQKHKLDMMRDIPGFIDARLDKDGTGLLIRVAQPLLDEPRFVDGEGEIPFKLQVDFPDGKAAEGQIVVGLGNEESAAVGPQSDDPGDTPGVVGTVAVPLKRPIGPHETGARNKEAYEAWKKRHNIKTPQ